MARYRIYLCGLPASPDHYPPPSRDLSSQGCAGHTPSPPGYLQWHDWAETMARTHRTAQCPDCGLWAIWVPKQ